MSIKYARLISFLFHPILMVLYMIIIPLYIKLYSDCSSHQFLMLYGMIITGYLIIPSMILYLLYKIHYIKTLHFEEKQDKMIVYLVFGLFYYATFQLGILLDLYHLIHIYILITILIIAAYISISFFYEISSHSLFMGAFTGFFIGLGYDLQQNYLILILLLIIISGWVLSSQLFLKRHTFREVYSGFFIGLCGLILLFLLLSK